MYRYGDTKHPVLVQYCQTAFQHRTDGGQIMPTARFKTTVDAREHSDSRTQAVANCAKYLAYSDQTDVFGYHAHIESVSTSKTGKYQGQTKQVTFDWTAPIAHPDDFQLIEREMSQLSRVESHECVSNPLDEEKYNL